MSSPVGPGQIPIRSEIARKLLHLVSLVIPAVLILLGRVTLLYFLVPLTLVLILSEVVRAKTERGRMLVSRFFGFIQVFFGNFSNTQ